MKSFLISNWQWTVTTAITVLGLFITYKAIGRQFKNEVNRIKKEANLKIIQSLPSKVYELFSAIAMQASIEDMNSRMIDVYTKVLCYGSESSIKIVNTFDKEEDKEKKIVILSMLFSQVKFDVTGEKMRSDMALEYFVPTRLYDEKKCKKAIKDLIKELALEESLYVN